MTLEGQNHCGIDWGKPRRRFVVLRIGVWLIGATAALACLRLCGAPIGWRWVTLPLWIGPAAALWAARVLVAIGSAAFVAAWAWDAWAWVDEKFGGRDAAGEDEA